MGFTRAQALKALKATQNNVERATEWIFSHTEDMVRRERERKRGEREENREEERGREERSGTPLTSLSFRTLRAVVGELLLPLLRLRLFLTALAVRPENES
jgi:hypothetical protein